MKFVGAMDENHTISTKQVINTIKHVHAEFHDNSVSVQTFYELQKNVRDLEARLDEHHSGESKQGQTDEHIQEQLVNLSVLPRKVNLVQISVARNENRLEDLINLLKINSQRIKAIEDASLDSLV